MADVFPEFSPTINSLFTFIEENLTYPQVCGEGSVYTGFIVEPGGELSNKRIVKGIHPMMDKHALSLIDKMPDWIPGTCNGDSVAFYYILPIRFNL